MQTLSNSALANGAETRHRPTAERAFASFTAAASCSISTLVATYVDTLVLQLALKLVPSANSKLIPFSLPTLEIHYG